LSPGGRKRQEAKGNYTMKGFMVCTPKKILFTPPYQGWDWQGVWYCGKRRRDTHTEFGRKASKKDSTRENLAFIRG